MMKKLIFLLVLTMLSFSGYSQFDTGEGSLSIPPAPITTEAEKPKSKPFELPPTIKDPEAETENRSLLLPKKNIDLTQKNDFADPGKSYEAKHNNRGEGDMYKVLRKDQYLGDYVTTSPYIIVRYRDHGAIDGDKVRLLNNDVIWLDQDYLDSDFKSYKIDLTMGFNKIDVLALNQGTLGPNTAQYEILDSENNVISAKSWELATGFKAILIIVRQ